MKVAVLLFVGSGGAVSIAVFGACVSTVHVKLAGVGSGLPAASMARTWNV